MRKRTIASTSPCDQPCESKRHCPSLARSSSSVGGGCTKRRGCLQWGLDSLGSVRRGIAYVWLHYIYGPCRFRQRAAEAHNVLVGRSSSLRSLGEAISAAEQHPFHASISADMPTFFREPAPLPTLQLLQQALPQKRETLRSALEIHRMTVLQATEGLPLCRSRLDPNFKHWFARVPLEVTRSTSTSASLASASDIDQMASDADLDGNKTGLFDSAIDGLLAATPDELLAGLHIRFHSSGSPELGVDSGGLVREFLENAIRELVQEKDLSSESSPPRQNSLRRSRSVEGLGEPMFKEQADRALMLISSRRPLAAYFALGHLVAAALVHASYGEAALPVTLNDCLLKYIVGEPLSAADVRCRDPIYFQNRIELLLQPGGIETMAAVLLVDRLVFVSENDVELIPGGSDTAVTQDNVEEYVRLLSEEYVCGRVRKELSEFLAGFHDVIPQNVLRRCAITFSDLGMLLSGVPEVDVNAWEQHASIKVAGVSEELAVRTVDWLFRTLETWPQEDLGAVLAFVTGCSRLPAVGFGRLDPPFTIEVIPCSGQLPTAHTCFNCLSLPAYENMAKLADRLVWAIHEGASNFALR